MSEVSTSTNKTKNLVSCYHELLNNVPLEVLFEKHVHFDVLVALELKRRGISLEQLADFVSKRDAHLATMRREKL